MRAVQISVIAAVQSVDVLLHVPAAARQAGFSDDKEQNRRANWDKCDRKKPREGGGRFSVSWDIKQEDNTNQEVNNKNDDC